MKYIVSFVVITTICTAAYAQTRNSDLPTPTSVTNPNPNPSPVPVPNPNPNPSTVPTLTPMRGPNGERPTPTTPSPYEPPIKYEALILEASRYTANVATGIVGLVLFGLIVNIWFYRRMLREMSKLREALNSRRMD